MAKPRSYGATECCLPVQSGNNLAVVIYYDKYGKEGEEIQELPGIKNDALQMQDLLTRKFGYSMPSEDPTLFYPDSFANSPRLVSTFEAFLKRWKQRQPLGTIVDRFLLYYHGHGVQVIGHQCLLTSKWTAIPLAELVNLVVEHVNPTRYYVINDCCSNNLNFNTDVAIARMSKAIIPQKAKRFEDRYLEINAAPSGHTASALVGKTLTAALLSILEESLRREKRGVSVLELEDLLRDEQTRQKSHNFPKVVVPPQLRNDFFPVSSEESLKTGHRGVEVVEPATLIPSLVVRPPPTPEEYAMFTRFRTITIITIIGCVIGVILCLFDHWTLGFLVALGSGSSGFILKLLTTGPPQPPQTTVHTVPPPPDEVK